MTIRGYTGGSSARKEAEIEVSRSDRSGRGGIVYITAASIRHEDELDVLDPFWEPRRRVIAVKLRSVPDLIAALQGMLEDQS